MEPGRRVSKPSLFADDIEDRLVSAFITGVALSQFQS